MIAIYRDMMTGTGRTFPSLSSNLQGQLAAIEPVPMVGGHFYPAAIKLRSGRTIDRVNFISASFYSQYKPRWPDPEFEVPLSDIVSAEASALRTPINIVRVIERHGEDGMGYHRFLIRFSDGESQGYYTGNSIEFLDLPEGYAARDMVAVEFFARDKKVDTTGFLTNHPVHWVIYDGVEGEGSTGSE